MDLPGTLVVVLPSVLVGPVLLVWEILVGFGLAPSTEVPVEQLQTKLLCIPFDRAFDA